MGWTRQEVLNVARSTMRPVVEAWSSHDAGQMGTVVGPMLHHTGSTWSYPASTAPTLRTVREGRSDLQNALCMYYIDYAGTIYCITEKIAWHAGGGAWQGIADGNGHYAGIEAESDGQQWTQATVASYKALAAAILRKAQRTVDYAPRHAEYALPPGRKTDFAGLDATAFRADVTALLAGTPTPVIDPEGPEMRLVRVKENGRIYTATDLEVAYVGDPTVAAAAVKAWGQPEEVSQREVDLLSFDANARRARHRAEIVADIVDALAKQLKPAS